MNWINPHADVFSYIFPVAYITTNYAVATSYWGGGGDGSAASTAWTTRVTGVYYEKQVTGFSMLCYASANPTIMTIGY